MRFDPAGLPAHVTSFLIERHLATVTTLRPDGTPHVVPVGFTWDGTVARVITSGASRKAVHADGARVALCQVDGRRWITLEGKAVVSADPSRVAEAVRRYAERYRQPRVNPQRVVIEITVDRIMGNVATS